MASDSFSKHMFATKMDEFWIGDRVRVIATGRTGLYEGVAGSFAKVRFGTKIILHKPEELMAAGEEEVPANLTFPDEDEQKFDLIEAAGFSGIIDLHLDKLTDDHRAFNPLEILPYQKKRCREFLRTAISLKRSSVEIIHGKGEGILKEEVKAMLDGYPEVSSYTSLSEGSLKVYFGYA